MARCNLCVFGSRKTKKLINADTLSRVCGVARRFKKLPSEIMNIKNSYEAFCYDEACSYFLALAESDKYKLKEKGSTDIKPEDFAKQLQDRFNSKLGIRM